MWIVIGFVKPNAFPGRKSFPTSGKRDDGARCIDPHLTSGLDEDTAPDRNEHPMRLCLRDTAMLNAGI